MNNVIAHLRAARPEALVSVPDANSPQTLAVLERILVTERSAVSPSLARRLSTRRGAVALGMVTVLGTAGLLLNTNAPTATAIVRKAAASSANARSGRASMNVTSTFDGQNADGTVELAWSGANESYHLNYPNQYGTAEIRLVNGKQYQRNGTEPWQVLAVDPTLWSSGVNTGRLASVTEGFEALTTTIEFEELANDRELRHFRAEGDLGALDKSPAGFVFGTNGHADARTTSLEVWTENNELIRKVQVSFVGTADGHQLTATATTEIHNLGADIVIENPS